MQDNFEIKIVSFLDRSMDEKDRRVFEKELADDENKRKLFFDMKDIWDSSNIDIPDTEEELQKFKKKHISSGEKPVHISRNKYLYAGLRIAAVLLIGIVLGKFVISPDPGENVLNSVTVPRGSKSTITLSDGSRVILNSGSTLSYPSVFDKKAREVEIDGEGYFSVSHNPGHPFIVKTADYNVRVLGTEFNVFAYKDFTSSTTSLVNGSIEIITRRKQSTGLEPGQKITYQKKNNKYIVASADIANEASWKDDVFSFKDEPINDLIKRLELWYNVDIDLSPDLNTDATFTGKFRNHETIWQALDAIKETTAIRYERTGFREFRLSYNSR